MPDDPMVETIPESDAPDSAAELAANDDAPEQSSTSSVTEQAENEIPGDIGQNTGPDSAPDGAHAPEQQEMPFAFVHGEAVLEVPRDLYIPPDALEIILEAFEGPLDLLLYLIRRQNLDILDIPIAAISPIKGVTEV